jgi:hypothetical protein
MVPHFPGEHRHIMHVPALTAAWKKLKQKNAMAVGREKK